MMIDKKPIQDLPIKHFGDKHFSSEFNTMRQYLLDTADAINGVQSGYKGYLKISDDRPTEAGLYKLLEIGDYVNLTPAVDENGNPTVIKAENGKINDAYFNGTVWVKSEVDLPQATADGEVLPGDLNAVSGDVVYSSLETLKSGKDSINLTITNYYISKSTTIGTVPVLTSSALWNLSSVIDVSINDIIERKGSAVLSSSATAEIHCLDADDKYLGYINKNSTSYQVAVSEMPAGTKKIRSNSAASYTGEFSITKTAFIAPEAVNGLDKISDLNKLVVSDNSFDFSVAGYLNSSGGEVLGSTAWKVTPFVPVSTGQKILYTGNTSVAAYPLWGYDSKFNPVISLSAQGNFTDKEVTIPSGVVYVRASARNNAGDVQRLNSTHFDQTKIDPNSIAKGFINDTFFPSKTWAKSGEAISLNINGFVNKHPKDYSKDTFFNIGYGNEDFIRVTPTADMVIPVLQRQLNNMATTLGNVNLKVALNANSPSSAQYFTHMGDSTVLGLVNSGIQGAIINEVFRRLTGIGYNLTPGTAPAPLSLSNLFALGTKGDQPIKHEGNGGWSWNTWLTQQSASGGTNSFYNPSVSGTNKFDLNYFLTQNNFNGVNSTGSNWTILVQLGWNDVFNFTISQIETNVRTWLDLVKSQKSGIRIKLISMQLPPIDVYKTYTGTRQQSYISTMQKVMSIARLYEKIALDPTYSAWVEHISYMGTFFPENAYPSTDITVNNRDTTTEKVYTDDVHPIASGYAQMADTLFYNILYNYCQ